MNLENFTIRSQEAIQLAFSLARDSQHQAVETGHLLKALLNSGDGIADQLLKKSGVQTLHYLRSLIGSLIHIRG